MALTTRDLDGRRTDGADADHVDGAKVRRRSSRATDFTTTNQIVLGDQTLALLHKKVGQTVVGAATAPRRVRRSTSHRSPLTIVGTATFPAVGYATAVAEHTSMGTGALVPLGVQPRRFTQAISEQGPEPQRTERGIRPTAPGRECVRWQSETSKRIAHTANVAFNKDPQAIGNYVTVLGVQRPAQIVDYRSIGATPELLATGLAAGAVIALALTLIASVRRRRRDLAIMKTLGFTRRMLAAAVAWQATIDGLIGALIGIPLGILFGRELWTLFARDINAVPQPTVPAAAPSSSWDSARSW